MVSLRVGLAILYLFGRMVLGRLPSADRFWLSVLVSDERGFHTEIRPEIGPNLVEDLFVFT